MQVTCPFKSFLQYHASCAGRFGCRYQETKDGFGSEFLVHVFFTQVTCSAPRGFRLALTDFLCGAFCLPRTNSLLELGAPLRRLWVGLWDKTITPLSRSGCNCYFLVAMRFLQAPSHCHSHRHLARLRAISRRGTDRAPLKTP